MDVFLLYLFTRLDTLIFIAEFFAVFGGICSAALGFFWLMEKDTWGDEGLLKVVKKACKTSAIIVGVALSVVSITPSKEDVAFIVAGKVGIELAQTEEAKETTGKLYQLLQKKLDEQLAEEK